MAKVATARAPLPSNTLHYDGVTVSKVTTALKRKTPSELRGEQLKRKNIMELVDESPDSVLCSMRNTNGVICGIKKPDIPKNPKYIDTRMDDLFPVKKNSIKLKLLSRKENIKENIPSEPVGSLKSSSTPSDSTVESRPQNSRLENSLASSSVKTDIRNETCSTEKCGESTFRSVTELSLGGGISSGLSAVDMDKAFQGLVQEPPVVSASSAKSFERTNGSTSINFNSEVHIPGRKIPLDVTLKTVMRVVSSSSVNRFHRSMTCGTFSDMEQFKHQGASSGGQNMTSLNSTNHISSIKSAHSWVYPQSSLPPSVISALALAATEGGRMDFLSKRQLAWEDSFRNLYYMLRKNICNIFYVCSAQFVVLFTSVDIFNEGKVVCNAYISQSTRSLRSILKEHDISFSMPLSNSKVEQVTTEDLAELSEIEKHNLGQTRRLGSLSDGDNSPQSLLAFEGNGSVHGLYDLLLNYRFVLTSMTGMDVPILYSPVAFENASFSVPEVRCKEVRRADHMPVPLKENNMTDEPNQVSSSGFCYSIEIRDSYLPPWVIASLCDYLDAGGCDYETSFVTEPTSTSLNVGLDVIWRKFDPKATDNEGFKMNNFSFGIPNTIYSPQECSAYLKGLKYCNGSYTASLSPV